MRRSEFRLAGTGGQGVILASIILADAAIRQGLNAVQTQAYGPEARGGASCAEVVIAGGDIDYPAVESPDAVVVLSPEACRKYAGQVRRDGLVVIDSSTIDDCEIGDAERIYNIPISAIARDVGRELVANIVALGVLCGLTEAVDPQFLKEAVAARVPAGTEDLNFKALAAGLRAAAEAAGEGSEAKQGEGVQ